MIVFLSHLDEDIELTARAEGPNLIGDYHDLISPGESFLGWDYEEIRALGEGRHDLKPKSESGDKALSANDVTAGGALVPPAQQGSRKRPGKKKPLT